MPLFFPFYRCGKEAWRGIETAQADTLNFQLARKGGTRKWKTIMAVCELQVQTLRQEVPGVSEEP